MSEIDQQPLVDAAANSANSNGQTHTGISQENAFPNTNTEELDDQAGVETAMDIEQKSQITEQIDNTNESKDDTATIDTVPAAKNEEIEKPTFPENGDQQPVNDTSDREASKIASDAPDQAQSMPTEEEVLAAVDAAVQANTIVLEEGMNAVRQKIAEQMNVPVEHILSYKTSIKARVVELFSASRNGEMEQAEANEENQQANADEGADGEEEEEENYEEEEEAAASDVEQPESNPFADLPDEWKARYGQVVWCKSQKKFPWWPGYIYDPVRVSGAPRKLVERNVGKKHIVYFYATGDYDVASDAQLQLFEGTNDEKSKQKEITKRDRPKFEQAVQIAEEELALNVEDRVQWNHEARRRRKAQKAPTSAKKRRRSAAEVAKESEEEDADKVEEQAKEEDEDEEEESAPSVAGKEEEESEGFETEGFEEEEGFEEYKRRTQKPNRRLTKGGKRKIVDDDEDADEPPTKRAEATKSKKRPRSLEGKPRKERKSNGEPAKKRKSTPTAAPMSAQTRHEVLEKETREDRITRLSKLLGTYTGVEPAGSANVPKSLRTFDKLREAQLTVAELRQYGLGKLVSKLCKHSDASIVEQAKSLKHHWTSLLAESAAGGSVTPPRQEAAVTPQKDATTITATNITPFAQMEPATQDKVAGEQLSQPQEEKQQDEHTAIPTEIEAGPATEINKPATEQQNGNGNHATEAVPVPVATEVENS